MNKSAERVAASIDREVRDELARKHPELSVNNALRRMLRMPLRRSRGRGRKTGFTGGKQERIV